MFHIVDGEEFICDVMIDFLAEVDCKAIAFSSPTEYSHFVSSPGYKKPIAVFTDVQMPAMNGYEMINAVSKLAPDLKFVVISGAPEIRSEYMDKACMYLGKPFDLKTLIQVVENLMRCHVFSSADYHRCISIDNQKVFPLKNWACPKSKDCD